MNRMHLVTSKKFKIIMFMLCYSIFIFSCSTNSEPKLSQNSTDTLNKVLNENGNISKLIDDKGISEDTPMVSLKDGEKDETLTVSGQDYEYYGNLPQNIYGETNEILLCKDPVYNIVYYVNYGDDYYIYRLKDGQSQLVVEIPAKRLFAVNGNLYFMVESYHQYDLKDLENGNILKYDPIKGEVSVVIKENASFMFVYQDGIYFRKEYTEELGDGISTGNIETYYYSFGTKEVKQIDDNIMTLYRWKDYFVSYVMEETEPDETLKAAGITDKILRVVSPKLISFDKSQSIILDKIPFITSFYIIENQLYYLEHSNILLEYNIESGEITEIPLGFDASNGLLILDDVIYTNNILSVDRVTGGRRYITSDQSISGKGVKQFYTDGENIYGIVGNAIGGDTSSGVMRRLQINKMDNEIRIQKKNGVEVEWDQFQWITLPMGEE